MIYGNLIKEDFEINITSDQIRLLIESFDCNEEILTEGLSDTIDKYIIGPLSLIPNGASTIYKCAEDIVGIIKSYGLNKSSIDEIAVRIDEMWNSITKDLNVLNFIDPKEYAGYDFNKITKSFHLLLWLFVFNSLINTILCTLIGPIGNQITICVIGPIIEESAKQIAIRGDFALEFTIVFNTFEFTSYVTMPIKAAKSLNMKVVKSDLIRYMGARLGVVGMHLSTTLVQWLSRNPKLQSMFGIKTKEDKAKLSMVGKIIGTIIHIAWNSGLSAVFVGSGEIRFH